MVKEPYDCSFSRAGSSVISKIHEYNNKIWQHIVVGPDIVLPLPTLVCQAVQLPAHTLLTFGRQMYMSPKGPLHVHMQKSNLPETFVNVAQG